MKAIFAVTALAAAISAQAFAADTEITTSANGAMDVNFILDMNADPSTYDVDLKEDDFNYGLKYTVKVANGPFSGKLYFEAKDTVGTPGKIEVKDLIVTEGNIKFGQVGKLQATDKYTKVVKDLAETRQGVDVGLRYMVSEGFNVQLQGKNGDANTATGVAAQYKVDSDTLSYVVEGEATLSANEDETPVFVGAGVTYKADVATVKAAVNYQSDLAGDSVIEYVANVESTVAGATVKAGYEDLDTATDDNEYAMVEVSYAAGAVTPSAGYEYTSMADAGDKVWGKLAYSQDAVSASAKVSVANFDAPTADEVKIELAASTKTESGITYYAEYGIQKDALNKVTLGAKYSF